MMPNLNTHTPASFWEGMYRGASRDSNGQSSHVLEGMVKDREPGRALDLGCAKGDNTVWLAKRGWTALGVDIAPSAIQIAQENAARNTLSETARFEQHDLAHSFPAGSFDLIFGMFLETPFELPRSLIMQRAGAALNTGGMLLMVTHQKVAPWSWGDPDFECPTAEARLAEMGLDLSLWSRIFVGPVSRVARSKDGQTATVVDAVVALEKL